jgi:hypothetical protein
MHQRSSLSANSALARCILAATSLATLAGLSGCNGDAYNLGEDEGPDEQESTCVVEVSSSSSIFALSQADVDRLSGCRELPGSLYIRVPAAEQETFTLAALSELEVVHGLLSIAGPLRSLEGLESLEQAGNLELERLRISDLAPLANLKSLQRAARTDVRSSGTLQIVQCDELIDLRGLESLTTWSSLSLLDLDSLVTLDGLQSPPLVDMIDISLAPRLADVSALAPVEEAELFSLGRTAVENLDGFALEKAQSVGIYANHALTDLDGLGDLLSFHNLWVHDNDGLLRVELPSLEDFAVITIVGNAVLRAVPHYPADTYSWTQHSGGVGYGSSRASRNLFEVGDNPEVESISLPTDFTDIERIAIYQNPRLTGLDMGSLQRSNSIAIQDNAVLASVAAPALARVEELSISNNPALSVAPFANVQTFARKMTGNLDEPAP